MKISVLLLVFSLSGCVQWGQSIMVSRGQAGAMAQVFGSQGEFCKLTSTEGVTITEADREAFRKYCTQ